MKIKKIIEELLLERDVEMVHYSTEEAINSHKERCDYLIGLLERANAGGWIPCSERLPEENVAVLVSTNDGAIGVDYYGAFCRDFIGLKGTYQKAIAWQPLPAPYQKGE